MTDIPRITEWHVDHMAPLFPKDCPDCAKVLSLLQGLADGSLRCADSKTEVVVSRAEMEEAYKADASLAYSHPHLGLRRAERFSRWLSTPEQPATETT